VVYENTYGSTINCVDDLPGAWKKLEGVTITSCLTCPNSDGTTPVVAFISDQSSTTGLSFTFTAGLLTQPF